MPVLDYRPSNTSPASISSTSSLSPSSSVSPLVLPSTQCDQTFTAKQGIIQTPNFPNKFPVPIQCTWIINASTIAEQHKNVSIIVYFTQQYVLGGLKFEEYAYYSNDFKAPIKDSGFEITEQNVTQIPWVSFHSPYLKIIFTMDNLYGTHLRVLDHLLDVYGFNITYEISLVEKPDKRICNALSCRFLGHCYATHNFS